MSPLSFISFILFITSENIVFYIPGNYLYKNCCVRLVIYLSTCTIVCVTFLFFYFVC